jgi:uncharacterized protein YndB with AHSA1/START domain
VARTTIDVAVPPERVFDVLSDPGSYGEWVVGSRHVRDAEDDWPAVGSRFHHSVGKGPFTIEDHTEVVEAEPPTRLVLSAKARPLGSARVELRLQPTAGGTRVVMVEHPENPVLRMVMGPLGAYVIRRRNDESLRRLKRLAERR